MVTDNMKSIRITATGHYHPRQVIDNDFFTELDIGSEASWVGERTGIQERRSVLAKSDLLALRRGDVTLDEIRRGGRLMTLAEMGEQAWQVAAKRNPSILEGVDLVLCGTSIPDYDIPANACTIAAKIGLECTAFDVNSACSSFLAVMSVARGMIQSGQSKKVAVFVSERYSTRLDYTDRASCVLFGDGCGMAVVEADDRELPHPKSLEVVDTQLVSAPSKFDLVQIPVGGYFYQNGKAVQKFAITRTMEATKKILERNQLTTDQVTYFIGHQANLRMLTSAAEKLGFGADQHLFNVDYYGNQGGAGAPAVMSTHWDRFKTGDLICMAVVGSGLTWGSALFRVQS